MTTRPAFVRLVGEKTQREERKEADSNKRPITIQIQCGPAPPPDETNPTFDPNRRQKPPRISGKRESRIESTKEREIYYECNLFDTESEERRSHHPSLNICLIDAADSFLPPVRDSRNLLQVNLLCEVRVYNLCGLDSRDEFTGIVLTQKRLRGDG